jgi:hypothetical protein
MRRLMSWFVLGLLGRGFSRMGVYRCVGKLESQYPLIRDRLTISCRWLKLPTLCRLQSVVRKILARPGRIEICCLHIACGIHMDSDGDPHRAVNATERLLGYVGQHTAYDLALSSIACGCVGWRHRA